MFVVYDRCGAVGRSRYHGHGVVAVGRCRLTTIVVVIVKVVGGRDLHGRYHFRFEAAVLDIHDFGRRRFDRRMTATAAAAAADPVDGRATRSLLHVPRFPAVVVAAVLRLLWRRRHRRSRRQPRRRRLDDRRLHVVRPRYRVLGRPHRLAGPERRYRRFARGLQVVLHANHVIAVGRRLLMRILRRRVPVHRVAVVVLLLRPGVASRRSRPAVSTPVVLLLQQQLLLRMVFADAVQMVVVMVIELTVQQRHWRRLVHGRYDVVAVQRLQLLLLRKVLLIIVMMGVLLLLVVVIFVIIVVIITVKVRILLIDSRWLLLRLLLGLWLLLLLWLRLGLGLLLGLLLGL